MEFFLAFLEGIITFVSPCLLPMLPVYISYFAGAGEGKKGRVVLSAAGFVAGFSLIFVILGTFAGTAGRLLIEYRTAVNIVSGAVLVLFGLNYMGILNIPFLNRSRQFRLKTIKTGFFSSMLFGVVFSVGWTPCVGAFLGLALMQAVQEGEAFRGFLMLLFYSAGLGIPFFISALLIESLKTSFDFIKKHYRVVNLISGLLLIIMGVFMMTGLMGRLLQGISF
ncbi:MAG: cytochrome c biogenesis protein CcdA [Clostridiales bacterium]|nr:cytochrome c biogenesis protein CcdA [Clostridiales bacterium]